MLDAAGRPNEYNTATYKTYSDVLAADGPFHTFMNDPHIQTLLHTRGTGAVGINFDPIKGHGEIDKKTGDFSPGKWTACNDEVGYPVNL